MICDLDSLCDLDDLDDLDGLCDLDYLDDLLDLCDLDALDDLCDLCDLDDLCDLCDVDDVSVRCVENLEPFWNQVRIYSGQKHEKCCHDNGHLQSERAAARTVHASARSSSR